MIGGRYGAGRSPRGGRLLHAPATLAVALVLGPALLVSPIRAQERPTVVPPARELPGPIPISPRGAFLRAIALPGWGHAAIGSYSRGGFYFGAQAATAYTFLRTRLRLSEARERLTLQEGFRRTQLTASGITDLDEIESALASDPVVAELRRLEESRSRQQEDIVALGIFILFLSGADAYVSAHLARFPEPLEVQAAPEGNGRFAVRLRLALRN